MKECLVVMCVDCVHSERERLGDYLVGKVEVQIILI